MTSAQEHLYTLGQARALTRVAGEMLREANRAVSAVGGDAQRSHLFLIKAIKTVDEAFAALGKLLPP